MDYKEFETSIRKAGQKRTVKIRDSYGVYDIYKHIRKNKWYDIGRPLKEHEFYSIIREVNNMLAKEIIKGNSISFLCGMGHIDITKYTPEVKIKEGKLKIGYAVNWKDTIKLWFEDAEARKEKILLRHEPKYIYHIKYNKAKANYKNKCFYKFAINRFIKNALSNNIKKGRVETLW